MALGNRFLVSLFTMSTSLAAPYIACVKVTIVSGKGEEMDGKYILKELVGEKPDEVCVDGCIYFKDENREDEYCFKMAESAEAAIVQCEVTLC